MNRTPFEVELADRLNRLADRAPATPGDRSTAIELQPALSGRSRRLGLLAAVAAALVTVVAGSWLFDRSESSDLVATDVTPTSDDGTSDVPHNWPLVGDEWTTISGGPADGRTFPVQVWTGTELIIWGGESEPETTWTGDGAAYDPLTNLWRDLAPSPLSARSEHLAVWTGTEVLICCGRAPSDESQAAAAYDPVADTWRVLSPPPFDSTLGVAVWTGAEMIVAGGVDLREAWAYSPASDEWRELSAPPTTIERSADIAWTGTRVIVWPGVFGTGSGLTYEPATDTWVALPSLPSDLAIWGGSMVWTGDEIIVWGNSRADDTDAVGARIRLDATEWTQLADDPLEGFRWWNGVPGSNSAAWTGTEMLVWAGAMGEADGSTRTLAYDPASDTWRDLGAAPTTAFGPDLLWTGDVALVMTSPITAIRPTTPSANPAPTPRANPATIQGVLPNGDRYEIRADPPLDSEVEGISAGIIIDLDDGIEPIEGPVVGIASFRKATGDERVGPNATGTSIVVVAGEWRLTISIYDHVLEDLGPDAASLIYDGIVPRTVADASDLPAFDLEAPLRWATDVEIPLQMEVMYREFVVRRGCSEVAAACSEDGIVEVVPIGEVVSVDTPWADNKVEIVVEAASSALVETGVRADVMWPLGAPDDTWPTSPEETARRFFAEVIGVANVPIGEANDSFVEVRRRDENGEPFGLASNVGFARVGDRFGVTEVSSPEVRIDEVSRSTDGRVSIRGLGDGVEGTLVRLWSGTDLVEPTPGIAGTAANLVPFEVLLQSPEATGPVMVIVQTSQGGDTDVPAVAALSVDAFRTVEDLYATAAEQLVSSVTGWVLPATSVVQGDHDAVVTLGDGVTEVSVLRAEFTPIAAVSDQIAVEDLVVEAGVVSITGEADPVGNLRVDIYHSLAGPPELFASGVAELLGGSELRSFEASVQLPGPAGGSSYVVLYDLGADAGDSPIALTLLPADLRETSE